SLIVSSGPLHDRIVDFNRRVVAALGIISAVTHLEVFHEPDGDLVFCEIAGRPGGGGVDRLVEQAYGVNLVGAALRLECGLRLPKVLGTEADTVTWGRVGFYPSGDPPPGIDPGRYAHFGIAEHKRSRWTGDGRGYPRHGSDYLDRY